MTHSDTETRKQDDSLQDAGATAKPPKHVQDAAPAEENVMPKKIAEPEDDLFDNMPI